jgi:hypothetical protein
MKYLHVLLVVLFCLSCNLNHIDTRKCDIRRCIEETTTLLSQSPSDNHEQILNNTIRKIRSVEGGVEILFEIYNESVGVDPNVNGNIFADPIEEFCYILLNKLKVI